MEATHKEGVRRMKAQLANDPAARVRRELASGRPARIVNRQMSVIEAVGRLVEAIEREGSSWLMRD
jgi:hypothetical protein